MKKNKYKMSFSTGGVFYHESLKLAELYLSTQDWKAVKTEALDKNLLQVRTNSTAKRIIREIVIRLECLSKRELQMLLTGDRIEQNALIWIAICRSYQFIFEFSTEVVREHYLNYQFDLSYDDFDSFFYRKADWNEDLEKISESTRKKLRQVLFKMLREVELISEDKKIIPAVLPLRLIKLLKNHTSKDLTIFPMLETA